MATVEVTGVVVVRTTVGVLVRGVPAATVRVAVPPDLGVAVSVNTLLAVTVVVAVTVAVEVMVLAGDPKSRPNIARPLLLVTVTTCPESTSLTENRSCAAMGLNCTSSWRGPRSGAPPLTNRLSSSEGDQRNTRNKAAATLPRPAMTPLRGDFLPQFHRPTTRRLPRLNRVNSSAKVGSARSSICPPAAATPREPPAPQALPMLPTCCQAASTNVASRRGTPT